MYLRLSCALLLCLCSQLSYAQKNKQKNEPDKDNMSVYLDDGTIGDVKNMLRIRFGTMLSGYLGASCERKFHRRLGVEVGAYFKAVNSLVWNENFRMILGEHRFLIKKTKGGLGAMIYPKFYFTGRSINNGYFFGFRNSFYAYNSTINSGSYPPTDSQHNVPSTSLSSVFMIGSHQHVGSRFTIGFEWGAGIAYDTYRNVQSEGYDYITQSYQYKTEDVKSKGPVICLDFIFGYLF
jgi:hypothetical protein